MLRKQLYENIRCQIYKQDFSMARGGFGKKLVQYLWVTEGEWLLWLSWIKFWFAVYILVSFLFSNNWNGEIVVFHFFFLALHFFWEVKVKYLLSTWLTLFSFFLDFEFSRCLKNQTYVNKVGYISEFLFGIFDELEKRLFIKKLLKWANKKCKNFNIQNVVFLKKK